jgi:hypothetical protein
MTHQDTVPTYQTTTRRPQCGIKEGYVMCGQEYNSSEHVETEDVQYTTTREFKGLC